MQTKIDALKTKLAHNPKNLDLLTELAQCMVDTKDYATAETYLTQIDQITIDNSEIKCFLGNVCYEQNKFAEAISWFSSTVALNPFHSHAYAYLGYANQKINNLSEATLHFEKSLELATSNEKKHQLYNTLGIIYLTQKNPEQAIASFTKALEIDPNSEIVLINLLSALPNIDDKLMMLLHLANLAIEKQEFTAARKYVLEVLRLEPSFSYAYAKLAEICLCENNFDGAINCAEIGLSLNPNEIDAYLFAAEGYLHTNATEKARALYAIALEKSPDNPKITEKLAAITLH